ncbi:hypothetical protein [Sutcliffiella horikoshii]|uniref:hypothetical protein n=1 Tax=Sutcliffiella horikoshii TaxID=79883 RepID=UPI001653C610|nr:hypothetical protein [Sutcliffiella horikoshii]
MRMTSLFMWREENVVISTADGEKAASLLATRGQMSEDFEKLTEDFGFLTEVFRKLTEVFADLTEPKLRMSEPHLKVDQSMLSNVRTHLLLSVQMSKH